MESDSSGLATYLALALILILIESLIISVINVIARVRPTIFEGHSSRGQRAGHRISENKETYIQALRIAMILIALCLGGAGAEAARIYFASHSSAALYTALPVTVLAVTVLGFGFLFLVELGRWLASLNPERALVILLPVVYLVRLIVWPFLVVDNVAKKILAGIGISVPDEHNLVTSAEELGELVARSGEAGTIEEDECELIEGVINFSDTVVREVMTPRKDVIYVREDTSFKELADTFTEHGFSRLLVVGDGLDDIKGLVLAKDLLPVLAEKKKGKARDIMRQVDTVSSNRPIDEVLQEFRNKGAHFAVVIDEHGGVDGVVTMEDLIEEIVGDIFDEYDSPEEEAEVVETGAGDLLVEGSLAIDDLNDLNYAEFPEGEYDTVAGFVISRLGHIPAEGESLIFNGTRIVVEEVENNRITRLRISKHQKLSSNIKELGDRFGSSGETPENTDIGPSKAGISGSK
ncbi:MAG: HlyC/CorC family transporter [Candidatus Dadabacteria bacterium]|nr:MAG: HlyC/CorC family transporter [Candidatus Dadabacteria bacterium]